MPTVPFKGKGKSANDPVIWIADEMYSITRGQYTILTIPKGSTVKQFETTNRGWTVWKSTDDKHWHIAGE